MSRLDGRLLAASAPLALLGGGVFPKVGGLGATPLTQLHKKSQGKRAEGFLLSLHLHGNFRGHGSARSSVLVNASLLQEALPDSLLFAPLVTTHTPNGIDPPSEGPDIHSLNHLLTLEFVQLKPRSALNGCVAWATLNCGCFFYFVGLGGNRSSLRQILILDLPLPGFEPQFLHLKNGDHHNAHPTVFVCQ